MPSQITKNTYRKRLISAALAIEAHAFGEKVMYRERGTEQWKDVKDDETIFNAMHEFFVSNEDDKTK